MRQQIVLVRGLPGSGKSTIAKTLALVGFVHVEADMYFETEDGYDFESGEIPAAHEWCRSAAAAALADGQSVVVSNTFTQAWELSQYADLATDFGADLRIIEAKGTWRSVHPVPGYALARMRERWESVNFRTAGPAPKAVPPARTVKRLSPVR